MTAEKNRTGLARSRPLLPIAVLAVAFLAAACGGSQTETATPSVASLPPENTESAAGAGVDGADEGESASDGGDSADGSDDQQVSEVDAEAAQLRYEQCLSDNGLDFGNLSGRDGDSGNDGDADGDADSASSVLALEGGVDPEAFEESLAECDEILEGVFGDFELSPEQEAEFKDVEARFNKCMADKGFELSAEGGVEVDSDEDFDEMEAAFAECDAVFQELESQLESDQEGNG